MAIKEPNKISALLITLNEEKNIDEVLDNLSFADEIIVVDSYSTDSTPERVQQRPKATLIQRKFKNYTDQKGFAMEQASYNWILFLDADERVTSGLKEEILQVVNSTEETASAYYFLRTFMFQDKVLRFSGWQTDKNYRLFKKSKVHFADDRIVHETLVVDGESKTLKNRLIHFSYSSYEDYKGKMLKYGRMKALDEFKKGKKGSWFHSVFRPSY
ncbi:MAG: glycosyltransferase family 2 protein, partial [Muricauda sp.]|nr:glycosyltransferase family 2 protein [Allomuricauda sp.]